MTDHVAWIKDLNQKIFDDIAKQRQHHLDELQDLRVRVDAVQRSISALDAKKDQLKSSEQLQETFLKSEAGQLAYLELDLTDDDDTEELTAGSSPVREKGKIKARIGEQRYLVLTVFRQHGFVTQDFATVITQLPDRRVKDAIVADLALGVLEDSDELSSKGERIYNLTGVGLDLMQRFDEYRRQKGQNIPRLPYMEPELIERAKIRFGLELSRKEEAVDDNPSPEPSTASVQPEAQGREAGPGGGG